MPGKLRIDRGELSDTLPHATESRQNGLVALVQRRVALLAKAFYAFGVCEDVLLRRELIILAGVRRRFLDFIQLKVDQIESRGLLSAVHPGTIELLAQRSHRLPRRGHSLDP